ncbi:DUF3780 domain-containing protein [Myxococcota bacterium]|nr:DUF3780 domain-containing protein [Myxococcota bacterium]
MTETVDFGASTAFGAHVFRVEVSGSRAVPVSIVEDYGLRGGESGVPFQEARAVVPRSTWSSLADAARRDFNERLKARRVSTGRWRVGCTLLDRLLGRELCVLVWAAEGAPLERLPVVCARWGALRPEERWWLFAATAAEAGRPEDTHRGWRRALNLALSDAEGDVPSARRPRPIETALEELPLFQRLRDG